MDALSNWSSLPGILVLGKSGAGKGMRVSRAAGNASRQTWVKPVFAATPVLAKVDDYEWPLAAMQKTGGITEADIRTILMSLNFGYVDTLENRLALSLVFARMISGIRRLMVGALVPLLAVVVMAFVYPVTDRDDYVVYALCMLALGTIFIAYLVLSLERLPEVSRLLCNTPAGLEFSWPVLVSVCTPFVVLLAAILVVEIPGVLEWGGGFLSVVLGKIGF